MQFLDSLQAATPLQLRPDRPASEHMLSYDQVQLDQASSELQQRRDREQLVQIDRLSELIRQRDRQLAQQETKQLERQLLFEIEVDRLRRILTEWDGERRRYQEDSRTKEGIYRARLEDLKNQLSAQFTQRVDQIRAETRQDLERIKELYDIRVAKLQEEGLKEEHRLRLAEMEADNKHGRLQLSEAERQKIQAALLLKDDRIAEMEEQLAQLQTERRKLRDDNDRLAEDRGRQLEYLRAQQEAKASEYEAAKALVGDLQATVEQLRADKEQYNEARRRAGDRVAALEIRCESLQLEVEQFRSRKTQHNAFIREASQNTLSHQQSERQQLSPGLKDSRSLRMRKGQDADNREVPNTEKERDYDQSLAQRVAELEEQLEQLQAEREREQEEVADLRERDQKQLANKDENLSKKEEEMKTLGRELQALKKTLDQREREMSRLRSSANDLQNKLSQKEGLILKLQADLQRKSGGRNDGGKSERVWLERIQKAEEALESLGQEWVKRERELAGLFKKIDATYRLQLQKGKETQERLKKENEQVHLLLMEKIKQLSGAK